jgi:hypothetical protein
MKQTLDKLLLKVRLLLKGYYARREVRFMKYRVAPGERDGIIRERLLERVARGASTC